jgi:hypothetical protein
MAIVAIEKAGREHVMAPDAEADEADGDTRENHDRVAEERLAREGRQDFRHIAHRGQNQNIHLGMAEDPEQMLPEDGLAAAGDLEEIGAEVAVEHHEDERDGDGRQGEDEQEARDERHPGEHRQAHHGEARGAQIDDRDDEVERGDDGGNAEHLQAEHPEVGGELRRELLGRERSVAEPAHGGGAAELPAGHEV